MKKYPSQSIGTDLPETPAPKPQELTLKKQLRDYLERHGMTAAELSRRSGVPKQVLSLWLGGVEPRKLSHLKRVAEVFGITLDELCYQSSHARPSDWIVGIFEGRLLKRSNPYPGNS